MKCSRFIPLLLCLPAMLVAQQRWDLKKNENGVKVYTGVLPDANIKSIRVESTLDATVSQLALLLYDVKAHEQWIYGTKTSYLLKKISESEFVYYSEVSMPFPFSNRDIVIDYKIGQNPDTKVMTVTATALPNFIPAKKGLVRVPASSVVWKITPTDPAHLNIEYTARTNPGGSIPAWIVNMFCVKGPLETFKKLRQVIQQPQYKKACIYPIMDRTL